MSTFCCGFAPIFGNVEGSGFLNEAIVDRLTLNVFMIFPGDFEVMSAAFSLGNLI